MKNKYIYIFLLLLSSAQFLRSQEDYPPVIPFATQGTDFWMAYPWIIEHAYHLNELYMLVVCDNDCDVTVSNERLGIHRVYHCRTRLWARADTNYIKISLDTFQFFDTLLPGIPLARQVANQPSNFCWHITSTDTIALYAGLWATWLNVAPILPTEMLRDEYVLPQTEKYGIIATEDSTVIDIVPSTQTWVGQPPGVTTTITLNKGQFYYTRKNLGGTTVKAHDCKRIAIIAGNSKHDIAQVLPNRFAGREHVIIPNTIGDAHNPEMTARVTALYDHTTVFVNGILVGTLNRNQYRAITLPYEDGPWVVNTSKPTLTYLYRDRIPSLEDFFGSMSYIIPTEYWQSNLGITSTFCRHDNNNNRYFKRFAAFAVVATENRNFIRFDDAPVTENQTDHNDIGYTVANIDMWGFGNSDHGQGPHSFRTLNNTPFMAYVASTQQCLYTAHKAPGKCYLYYDTTLVDSMPPGFGTCHTQPIPMRCSAEYPADSVAWDFGDGTPVIQGPYESTQQLAHTYDTAGTFTISCIISYPWEGCFTRKSDTLSWQLDIYWETDSLVEIHLCEGNGTFRTLTLEEDGEYHYTATGQNGHCDTSFTILFTTCPRCSEDFDTIALENLPWHYNGRTFNSETINEPVHISDGQECDSIIYYYLHIDPYYGEPRPDSVIILAPNVITPSSGDENSLFRIVANEFITDMEVFIFNRQGVKLAQFDGLHEYWDGTSNGRICPQGTYVYYIRYKDFRIHNWQTFYGTVTILR